MKLSELASEHKLDAELLKEVVEVDLSIRLTKGMDTILKEAEISRILACDGLETADGKPFTPIIPKEFEEKHKKKVATKKGQETKKRKAEAEAEAKKKEEDAKVEAERRKHEGELARREIERQEREALEAEHLRVRSESEALVHAETQRIVAEEDMKRRESEAKRIATELSAMRHEANAANAASAAAHGAAASTGDNTTTTVANEPSALGQPQARVSEPTSAPVQPSVPTTPAVQPTAPTTTAGTSTPATKTPVPSTPVTDKSAADIKAVKGIGSKLASLAKATHEKADHSIKAIPKPAAAAAGAVPTGPIEGLSSEDRRRLIQENIRKNLAMALKVRDAKLQARKKPGFAAIDRSKTPAPAGRGGPGGNRGPGGPARGPQAGRGPKRDSRDHRANTEVDADGNPVKPGSRRRPLSTEDMDLSGKTEFSVALPCTVREFSEASGIKSSTVIAKLFMAGVMANINSVIEKDAVELLAMEFKKTVTITIASDVTEEVEAEHAAAQEEDKPEDLVPRPPVVTIMGHVDHGKTSLLDAIRKTQIAAGEAGGITQAIGAYTVATPNGLEVTFIDTPGHEAFTEMRVRGSQVTDVVVIVVAADDGVMPQTKEAINHAKAAGVTIVVALNKIDKPEAMANGQREKVIRELAEAGLQAEEWGGEIAVVGTSATTGQGIEELLERLVLETDVLELKANHFAKASGTVIEAHRNEGQGVTATFLIQRGSLAIGDIVVAGTGYGRVRSMSEWTGERVQLAGPSHAVEIIGLNDMPRAGDKFQVLDELKQAAEVAEIRIQKQRERELAAKQKTTTASSIFGDLAHAKKKEIRIVIKSDAAGSMEVLNKTLGDLATEEVRVTVIHSGVGGINSSDVTLAEASKAMIIGFNVIADSKARALADSYSLQLSSFTIIYELLDYVRAAMGGMLDPETVEKVIGHAEVRATFTITKVGVVAGLFVTDGIARRDAWMRITRENNILHSGKVGSLRRFKEDVKEVREKFECGLTVEKFEDIKVGDTFEFFTKEKVARTL
ncbi:MAG: translation initiation factor IF-2 [Planctomycetes bacterium]|nr:translation initiation factor IF-2 [Planctomycetota bacterium]